MLVVNGSTFADMSTEQFLKSLDLVLSGKAFYRTFTSRSSKLPKVDKVLFYPIEVALIKKKVKQEELF